MHNGGCVPHTLHPSIDFGGQHKATREVFYTLVLYSEPVEHLCTCRLKRIKIMPWTDCLSGFQIRNKVDTFVVVV